ncbi:MAG: hypothetical protein KDK05_03355 [Candidatus Competibacteraceae bacterium]|nr:hypothetical protein [Candidatus Competibacteraceae bacterium]
MKRHGYIQPTPATAELWTALSEAKRRRDFVEVGRLSATIRTETIRNGQPHDSTSDSNTGVDSVGGVGGQ